MTVPVGGTRDRLIHDSVFNLVKTGLDSLGWFPGGAYAPADHPVTVVPEEQPWTDPVEPNTVSVAPFTTADSEFEVGSDLRQEQHVYNVDVFGANQTIGLHLSGDIRDILRGKFSTLNGYVTPESLWVYDWTTAPYAPGTPNAPLMDPIFFCEILSVRRDRPAFPSHRWQRYLYSIELVLVDYYNDDLDPGAWTMDSV